MHRDKHIDTVNNNFATMQLSGDVFLVIANSRKRLLTLYLRYVHLSLQLIPEHKRTTGEDGRRHCET